ncbi:MAG: HPr family phosphocarrier protein [Planctomyces sp.]|jgi:phosphocarrier protein|nr:HPr family phosphocarrier protein [Planctomyces sp.]
MSQMIHRRTVTVRTEHGLHLSPCSRVAQTAMKFRSRVVLVRGSVRADAKSVLDLMTLAAGPGAELELEVDGDDAPQAVDAILHLFEHDLVSAP